MRFFSTATLLWVMVKPSLVQSQVTLTDIAAHNTVTDCWTAVYGEVYDVTAYAPNHPVGATILVNGMCGKDGTPAFDPVHGDTPGYMQIFPGITYLGTLLAATPAPVPVPVTPAPIPATPAPIPVPATPAPVPVPTTPAPVPVPATPAPVPVPATPAPVPVPATPAPVPVPATPAPVPVPATPVPVPVPVTKPPTRPAIAAATVTATVTRPTMTSISTSESSDDRKQLRG
ncbi:fumarate reductase [Seminavis robusta]|uniref:Fumarate reductase n=1 Tax=Seminavis robusta TaxID=568900 RepID=A0A9N8D8M9_9STRA|nr:fumarate reductase [Seminavis robusta]|eukprot:Sro32_g020840.1 fumarate reductase (230) ;mRNA; f:87682-88561